MHLTSVLLPAPLPPSSACIVPGPHGHRDIIQRLERAEMLADVQGGQTGRRNRRSRYRNGLVGDDHLIPAIKLFESDTAPKTPFCMVTIFTAA